MCDLEQIISKEFNLLQKVSFLGLSSTFYLLNNLLLGIFSRLLSYWWAISLNIQIEIHWNNFLSSMSELSCLE